jgi:hypothetical protein
MMPMEFPAVWIAEEGSFGVIDAPMESASFVAYRNGFFDGLRFFDSSGTEWVVVGAAPGRKPTWLVRLLNRRIPVTLEMAAPRRPDLADVAERLCACVDRDPDDLYGQFMGQDELKAYFRGATSPAELIHRARTLGSGEGAGRRLPPL